MSRNIHETTAPYRHRLSLVSLGFMGSEDITLPSIPVGLARLVFKLAIILVAAYAIHLVMDWAMEHAKDAGNDTLMIGMFASLLVAYALLIAVPFMPGIEIGISLLLLKGAAIAPLVYLATVLGLFLAFAAGRYLPHAWVHDFLADLRLRRACELVNRLAPMTSEERLNHLTSRAPKWLRPFIGPWRYVILAALLNVPGNAVIGGGGGIAFTAGFSRLFRPGLALMAIALAVLPVPLTIWLWGTNALL